MLDIKDLKPWLIIKKYRAKRDLTQGKLAEKMEVAYQQVQEYEKVGYVPKVETWVRICNALSIPYTELFDIQENTNGLLVKDKPKKNYADDAAKKHKREIDEFTMLFNKEPELFSDAGLSALITALSAAPQERQKDIKNLIGNLTKLI